RIRSIAMSQVLGDEPSSSDGDDDDDEELGHLSGVLDLDGLFASTEDEKSSEPSKSKKMDDLQNIELPHEFLGTIKREIENTINVKPIILASEMVFLPQKVPPKPKTISIGSRKSVINTSTGLLSEKRDGGNVRSLSNQVGKIHQNGS